MNNMNKFERHSGFLTWSMALLLSVLAAGCGGGGGSGQDPILGTPGIGALVVPPVPPTVIAVAPLAGANDVAINITIITAQFSEPMNAATLTPATFTVACTTACAKLPTVATVTLDVTNTIATLTLANSPLVPLTTYTATVTTGAQSLATGLGLASPFVWNFTTVATADTTRPSVTFTVPANAGIGVAINSAITAVFSEEMIPATLVIAASTPASSFRVTCVSPAPCVSPVVGAVAYVVGSRTAVFTPAAPLVAGQIYTATITTAATDLAGNLLFSPVVVPVVAPQVPNPWTFTTAAAAALDTTAPILNATVPVNSAINVPAGQTLSATFNETMNTASVVAAFTLRGPGPATPNALIAGTASYDPVTSIALFNPTAVALTPGVYTATIANTATDLAGNALVVPPVGGLPVPNPWSFTVAAPVVPLALDLGVAAPFGVIGSAGFSSTGITVVNGDVAVTPTPSCTDASDIPDVWPPCSKLHAGTGLTVNGSVYFFGDPFDNGLTAFNVRAALLAAWREGRAKACDKGAVVGAELGGKTLTKGVYCNAASLGFAVGTILTLDAEGDVDAVFIFQVAVSMTDSSILANPSRIRLINGAQARNVWFVVGNESGAPGGDVTIGAGQNWSGNILAGNSVSINQNTTVNGRVLGGAFLGTGLISLTSPTPSVTTISVPAN